MVSWIGQTPRLIPIQDEQKTTMIDSSSSSTYYSPRQHQHPRGDDVGLQSVISLRTTRSMNQLLQFVSARYSFGEGTTTTTKTPSIWDGGFGNIRQSSKSPSGRSSDVPLLSYVTTTTMIVDLHLIQIRMMMTVTGMFLLVAVPVRMLTLL